MPDIENSRKTAEKGAEWVTVKQPKNSRENSRNTRKTAVLTVFRVFRLFSRLFFGCFTVTHSAPFSAVFRLFSMSGIWHLCSWPQRSFSTSILSMRGSSLSSSGALRCSGRTGKIKTYTGTRPPLFSKKAMPWGKKWPVQMNLPFFAVKAFVPGGGGGCPESGRKKFEKCLPAGTGTKIYFSSRSWILTSGFSHSDTVRLGVVLPHLPGEIFRAIFSQF